MISSEFKKIAHKPHLQVHLLAAVNGTKRRFCLANWPASRSAPGTAFLVDWDLLVNETF